MTTNEGPTIVNLTPHDVVVLAEDGTETHRYPASGDVLRLATIDLGQHGTDGPVWIELVEFGHLLNPPPKRDGVSHIVSLPCALARPRADFLVPFDEVRDDAGRIIGVRGLAMPV